MSQWFDTISPDFLTAPNNSWKGSLLAALGRNDPRSHVYLTCQHEEYSSYNTGEQPEQYTCHICKAVLTILPRNCVHPRAQRTPNGHFCTQCKAPVTGEDEEGATILLQPRGSCAAPDDNELQDVISYLGDNVATREAARLLADTDHFLVTSNRGDVSQGRRHAC